MVTYDLGFKTFLCQLLKYGLRDKREAGGLVRELLQRYRRERYGGGLD